MYIDGELRIHYDTKESRPFGTNSPTRYIPVELREADAGKELVYQFSTYSKYAGNIRKMYIGDDDGIWLFLLEKSTGNALISIGLLLVSLFFIVACEVSRFVYKRKLELRFLAWLIALLLYMNEVQQKRYQKLYAVVIAYCTGVFLLETVLQIFDVIQFTDQLIYVIIGIAFTVIGVGGSILLDLYKKRIREYRTVGIGLCAFLFFSVIELIWYYVSFNSVKGIFIVVGLLFLFVTAIIKTGHDLLLSEKKSSRQYLPKRRRSVFWQICPMKFEHR